MFYLKFFYNEVFYRPLLGALVFLTSILPGHDLGFAVILLTIIIRALIFPLTHRMVKTQNAMRLIEPKVKKVYEDYKNKEDQAKALMALYKEHGINPFSGFLSLLIQFPLLIALYQVFWKGIPFSAAAVYPFLTISGNINTMFLGLIALTEPNVGMATLAAVSQFWQAKLAVPKKTAPPKNDMSSALQWQMLYIFPVIIFIISLKLPAAVGLYWTAMNVFAIVHEAVVRRQARSQ